VVWDDKHGTIGLRVEYVNPKIQMELDIWLDTNFKGERNKSK
jgi:hypothetical protein